MIQGMCRAMILMGLVVVLAWGAPALGDDSSGKSKKDKALEEVAPSIGKGEAAAGVLDQLSQAIGKIVSSVMPAAPGAEEMGEAAGETATTGAKVVKDYRTRGDAVISDDGDVMIYNEETGKYEKF